MRGQISCLYNIPYDHSQTNFGHEILCGLMIALLAYYTLDDLYCIYWKGQPPGPLSLPLIGGLYMLDRTCIHKSLENLNQQYGPIFSLRMGPLGRTVFLNDMNLIKKVMESPHMNDRPPLPAFKIVDPKGDGIGSCAYDKRWKTMTKTVNRGLARLAHTSLSDTTDKVITMLLEKFEEQLGTPYDPRQDLRKAISSLLNKLIHGQEVQDLDSPSLEHGMRSQEIIIPLLSPMHPVNFIPGFWKLPIPHKAKVEQVLIERDHYLLSTMKEKVENFTGTIRDIMDVVAEFTITQKNAEDNQPHITTTNMLSSVWALYLAGLDTTVDSLLWCIQNICRFTAVQEKIRDEIEAINDEESILQNKDRLSYTRAAILESLRLSTLLVTGLPHTTNRDMVIGGYNINKGLVLMANQHSIHHNPNFWDDPDTMKPERFLNANGTTMSTSELRQLPFLSFSFGRRPCIGQFLALDIMLVVVTKLLRKYQIKFPDGFLPDINGELVLNLRPRPFNIILTANREVS